MAEALQCEGMFEGVTEEWILFTTLKSPVELTTSSSSVSSNSSMELKQKIKQWSPDEPDHALIHNNSSMDTPGLHSTLYSEFNESEQEAVRTLASLSNTCNSTPFSPLLQFSNITITRNSSSVCSVF